MALRKWNRYSGGVPQGRDKTRPINRLIWQSNGLSQVIDIVMGELKKQWYVLASCFNRNVTFGDTDVPHIVGTELSLKLMRICLIHHTKGKAGIL